MFWDEVSGVLICVFFPNFSSIDGDGEEEEEVPSDVTNSGLDRPKYFNIDDTPLYYIIKPCKYNFNPQPKNLSHTSVLYNAVYFWVKYMKTSDALQLFLICKHW